MSNFFISLFLLSLVGFVVGLIRPRWLYLPSRKRAVLVCCSATVLLFILVGVTTSPLPSVSLTAQTNSSTNGTASVGVATESLAYKLAEYDSIKKPDAETVLRYQTALDGLKSLCMEDEGTLAAEIWASWRDLKNNNVSDETNLTLMGHIKESIPPNSGPTDCRGVMAAYLLIREPKD